jgi:hypothetical protein
LAADDLVKALENIPPSAIADSRCAFGRADDIAEHHRGQHPIGITPMPHSGQKLLDLVEDCIGITYPREMVFATQLNVLRAGNPLRYVAPLDGVARSFERCRTNVGT